MAGDALKRVRAGDPMTIPAAGWNAAMDAVEAFRRMQETGNAGGGSVDSPGVVLVENTTGENVPRFGALMVDDILIAPDTGTPGTEDEFKNHFAFKGVKPATAKLGKQFVIALEALPAGPTGSLNNGKIGRALIAGPVVCNVTWDQASGQPLFAGPVDGSFDLKAGAGPARVLYRKAGTGSQLAVVQLGVYGPGDPMVVTLEQSGGSNGTQTTRATYTYKLKDQGGCYLGDTASTPIGPDKTREVGELVGPASLGLAYWNASGVIKLALAFEEYDTGPCS